MRATAISCVLAMVAGCGGGSGGTGGSGACITLGSGQLAGLGVPAQQIQIEARIIAIHPDSIDELGLDFPDFARMQQVGGGPLGGSSQEGRDVVVPAEVMGGPPGVPYLSPDGFGGFLSVVNLNFLSPFAAEEVKVFMALPLEGSCIVFDDLAVDPIQGFAGGADQAPLDNRDPGIEGRVLYKLLNPPDTNALLADIAADARNRVFAVPTIQTVSGQKMLIVLQDLMPQTDDLTPEFKGAVESVVTDPLGVFTGVTLDMRPLLQAGEVELDVRFGSHVLSFFRSVPAQVDGQPADVEIPLYKPSIDRVFLFVPDGQTIFIGGLLRDGQAVPEKGFPLLGDLPVVGSLLRQKTNDEQQLMIMITPRIVDPN
jgi:type II secretory pathway component GspD/PulD (secretin)